MSIKDTIQRKLHMGLFRYLGKFEELFKKEIDCDNHLYELHIFKRTFPR